MPKLIRRLLIFAILAGLVVLGTWYGTRPRPVQVNLAEAHNGTVELTVTNTRAGTVESCRRARLAPALGGQLANLAVREGNKVQAGQLLLELWNEDLQAELLLAQEEARTAAKRAEEACVTARVADKEAGRISTLHRKNLASEEAKDQAEGTALARRAACEASRSATRVSEARVGVVRAQLERTRLRAPFAATVAEVNGEVGEFITPSPVGIPTLPAVDLVDLDCLYVLAPIDEVDAPKLQLGMPARISLDAFGTQTFPGKVRHIASYVLDVEKQARTVDIEVEFEDPAQAARLLPGYSADAEVILQSKTDTLRIPTQALRDNQRVFLYDEASGTLVDREVKVGIANWNFTEILSGLQAGDRVVVSLDREGVEAGAWVTPETDNPRP